jgi:hypothetical protein
MEIMRKQRYEGHDQYFSRNQAVEPLLIDWFLLSSSAVSEAMKHEYRVFTPAASTLEQVTSAR